MQYLSLTINPRCLLSRVFWTPSHRMAYLLDTWSCQACVTPAWSWGQRPRFQSSCRSGSGPDPAGHAFKTQKRRHESALATAPLPSILPGMAHTAQLGLGPGGRAELPRTLKAPPGPSLLLFGKRKPNQTEPTGSAFTLVTGATKSIEGGNLWGKALVNYSLSYKWRGTVPPGQHVTNGNELAPSPKSPLVNSKELFGELNIDSDDLKAHPDTILVTFL